MLSRGDLKERLSDSSSQSDRSEQFEVIMPDQAPATEPLPPHLDDGKAVNPAAVAADADATVHSISDRGTEENESTALGAAAATGNEQSAANKPARVFKMSDEFLMFKFKIEMCSRKDRHDWKICPYAHPGEVARRRHPRGYAAVLCPAKTAASCPRREQCTFAHNPFEFWLHPDRFKTSLCNQGPNCDRPICFFAHKAEEVRRLAHGLEAAGPDDYVYATTASTPEPHNSTDAAPPPPPPPPPPRAHSLAAAAAGAAGLGFLQNNAILAAAAAAAAAAVSLNNAGLLLPPGATSPHQYMLLNGDQDQLLSAAGTAGLVPDINSLCNSAWLNSNSDPSLVSSMAGTGANLSVNSPIPLQHAQSTASNLERRSTMDVAGSLGSLAFTTNASTTGFATGSYGTMDPSLFAEATNALLAQQAGSSAASLAAAVQMAESRMAGSAPAAYSLLQGSDGATSSYHQQQQQLNQQQLLDDQMLLQQMLLQQQQQQQQEQAALASNAGLQQLIQQQQQALRQLNFSHQVQQPLQQWSRSSSLQNPQALPGSAPANHLLRQQQHQQAEVGFASECLRSNGSLTPPDNQHLAAALSNSGIRASGALSLNSSTGHLTGSSQVSGTFSGAGLVPHQQNNIRWSSSILSKQAGVGPVSGPMPLTTAGSADVQGRLGHSQAMTHNLGL